MSLIPAGRRIDAVLFDMDGTLIRSEDRTDAAVLALLAAHGIDAPADFDLSSFHGVTWAASAPPLVARWPMLAGVGVEESRRHETVPTFGTSTRALRPSLPTARGLVVVAAYATT